VHLHVAIRCFFTSIAKPFTNQEIANVAAPTMRAPVPTCVSVRRDLAWT